MKVIHVITMSIDIASLVFKEKYSLEADGKNVLIFQFRKTF